jgi:DNA-binding SARP family transcriptional activator
MTEASERLVAFLALRNRAVHRLKVAGSLWPDASDEQSLANLRSALWRLNGPSHDALAVEPKTLGLKEDIGVDLREGAALAHRIIDTTTPITDVDLAEAPEVLREDLLVGWYDEWALAESERWRQLRLHALEALAVRLVHLERFQGALDAALLCVEADPLRESAHAAVITTHLAEHNRSEALRAFDRCCETLYSALGLAPSERLRALVTTATTSLIGGAAG